MLRRWRRRVSFKDLRRTEPVSRSFGLARGRPIDRFYIDRFLRQHADDIRGCVLEFGDDRYSRAFGGNKANRIEILAPKAIEGDTRPTIIADLTRTQQLPTGHFDCIVCTQVLMFVDDLGAAVRSLHSMLRPGGVLLVTAAGISQICRYDMNHWGDYWRFTSLSMRVLLEREFEAQSIDVRSHGNVLAAVAFLHGLAQEDLTAQELERQDPDYEVIITARAVKSGQVQ
jgi:SAM-dependent methyltransferase